MRRVLRCAHSSGTTINETGAAMNRTKRMSSTKTAPPSTEKPINDSL